MTENHDYGPDLNDLNAGIQEETGADKKPSPESRKDSEQVRSEFYKKIRQDLPPDDTELGRHVDLEAEHGRTYDYD